MGIKFNAQLWSVKRDHEDEITIVLKVPASDALKVIGLPCQENLLVDVSKGGESDPSGKG
jgi:hypothetical protein